VQSRAWSSPATHAAILQNGSMKLLCPVSIQLPSSPPVQVAVQQSLRLCLVKRLQPLGYVNCNLQDRQPIENGPGFVGKADRQNAGQISSRK
jgi:hypothetical protein